MKTTKKTAKKTATPKLVIVRSTGAGVHIGVFVTNDANTVTLKDARRLWRWRGANTLNEVATKGVAQEYTRLSEPVPSIVLNGWHEIIPVAKAAVTSLTTSRWGE